MTAIRSHRVVFPEGVRPADIGIQNGLIAAIRPHGSLTEVVDYGDLVVMSGLVDSHVHVNQPGRTHWEGFDTVTRAAAAGGVTTIVDMPLNSVPATTNVKALHVKLASSHELRHVDVAFWGGVVPSNQEDLQPLAEAGVSGFKCFMVSSGVDEFEWVRSADIANAMSVLSASGNVLLAHCEVAGPIEAASDAWQKGDPLEHTTWENSRPSNAETEAIAALLSLAGEHDCRVHVVHLATHRALPAIRNARREGIAVTVETCPHYLTFASKEVPRGATCFKCAPPLRGSENRDKLWRALIAGEIDFVASDHSPSPKELKDGHFRDAWGGIASLELLLPATWTGARQRDVELTSLADWLCSRPARHAGVGASKGRIEAGLDADLVIWDPDQRFTVDQVMLQHRHPLTPYHGCTLYGVVQATWLRGQMVFEDGKFVLSRGRALFIGNTESARLNRLQGLDNNSLQRELLACCGSERWAQEMLATRPWGSEGELLAAADTVWSRMEEDDWHDAFAAHPRIGERKAAKNTGSQASEWSDDEQSGTQAATEAEAEELARLNQEYESRFGFVFLIFASGKSTPEMLTALRTRLEHDRDTELTIAASEQQKITRDRLQKLLRTG